MSAYHLAVFCINADMRLVSVIRLLSFFDPGCISVIGVGYTRSYLRLFFFTVFGHDFYQGCMARGIARVQDLGVVLGPYHPVMVYNVQRLRAMGIRDRPIAFRSPWQNAYVERLIGSIRRECLDHMIVFGEAHLRRILGSYAAYYNASRTHRSLDKEAPFHRAIERLGAITSHPVLGGLHHQYCRI